jgi:hypothetical protein
MLNLLITFSEPPSLPTGFSLHKKPSSSSFMPHPWIKTTVAHCLKSQYWSARGSSFYCEELWQTTRLPLFAFSSGALTGQQKRNK